MDYTPITKQEINNLETIKVVIDYYEEILIVHCLDRGEYEKSYYFSWYDLPLVEFNEQVIHVMRYGHKYHGKN
jgi:hypothetical protein